MARSVNNIVNYGQKCQLWPKVSKLTNVSKILDASRINLGKLEQTKTAKFSVAQAGRVRRVSLPYALIYTLRARLRKGVNSSKVFSTRIVSVL